MTDFIGRARELRSCLDLLHSTDLHGAVYDLVGVNGMGKSMFLDRLARLSQADKSARVFRLDMKEYGLGEGYSGEFGKNASVAMLRETLYRSREMLSRMAAMGSGEFDEFRALNRWGGALLDRQQARNTLQLGRDSKVEHLTVQAAVSETEAAMRGELRELQQRIDDAFVAAWERHMRKRRQPVLVAIDTFELVADDQVGLWLVSLARRLPGTLVVMARTPTMGTWLDHSQVDQIALTYFTVDEVAEYLRDRCHSTALADDVTRVVHGFTGGHPGGVGLVGDLIVELGAAELDAPTLRRVLDRLPAQPDHRWADLVDLILETARQPRLRVAVEAAAVAGTFTGQLLTELVSSGGAEELTASEAIPDLLRLRLLQQVVGTSGQTRNIFRLHEFLRLAIEARIPSHNRSRWLELHRIAADHFFRSLLAIEDAPEGSYASWYRFEDASWQDKKRQWLHHSGMLLARRPITRARFVLVFLKAFWWWGWYVPFGFNRSLLEDWGRAAAIWANASDETPAQIDVERERDHEFLDALAALLTNYPMGFPKPRDAPWERVREKLLLIRRLSVGSVSKGTRTNGEERRDIEHADAFIDVFLAHSVRFRNPSDERANRYYLSATAAFERVGDAWDVAWMLYERGDMAREAGDPATAVDLLRQSAERELQCAHEDEDWDHELLGNLHRLLGDLRWQRGEIGAAGVSYGRAVRQAYWMQGAPQRGPDEYTLQFYLELTTKAAGRCVELVDDARLAEFVAGLRTGAPEVCLASAAPTRTTVEQARTALFLPAPVTTELRVEGSTFMSGWRVRREDCPDVVEGLDDLRSAG